MIDSSSNQPNLSGAGLLAESAPGDNSAPLSVSELSGRLKRHVEDAFGYVRVRGEISGWKRVASGHCYLALKDEDAALDGVMWKGQAGRLAFAPADGVEVIATGKLTTYPGRSKYQIIIEKMELAGEGAMLALLEKVKAKLAGEGLFDTARKRPLPYLPHVIGVVTSPTGAVIRDILHRLADRFPMRVLVWPVLVQGPGAADQIAGAVTGFSAIAPGGAIPRPDLVIVARGGGSIEDLWCFNDEKVVRAVAASTIPTISAVGHETDTTLCDFAADMRAPTPTAAAELAVPVRADLFASLQSLQARSLRCVRRYQERAGERYDAIAARWPDHEDLFASQRQRVDDQGERLRRALGRAIADARGDLAHAAAALRPAVLTHRLARAHDRLHSVRLDPRLLRRPMADARDRLDRLARLAASLHPDRPLERGYARVEAKSGGSVTNSAEARRAGALTLVFAGNDRIDAHVDGVPSPKPRLEPKGAANYVSPESRQGSLL